MLGYIEFVKERMQIWYKKEILRQSPPWTENLVLQQAKFCNVYRELDTVSRYEIERVKGCGLLNCVYEICLLRHSNSIATFETLSNYLSRSFRVHETLPDEPVSTALICWNSNFPGESQVNYVKDFQKHLGSELRALADGILGQKTAKGVYELLLSTLPNWHQPYIGYNEFWCYELYTSLTYCQDFKWTEDDFYVIGPGCLPGLIRYSGCWSPDFEKLYQKAKAELESCEDYIWIPEEHQPKNPVPHKFTRRTFEHSLCEWHKYFQIYEGKAIRRTYPGS